MKHLPIGVIEEARIKVLENARELIEEAELLLANGRAARAYSLAHLACEELAKIPMFVDVISKTLRGCSVDWVRFNKRLHSHVEKFSMLPVMSFLVSQELGNDAATGRLREDLERIRDYSNIKNYGLYADLRDDKFLKPSEVISDDYAKLMVKIALGFLDFFEKMEQATRGKSEEIVKSPEYKAFLRQLEGPLRGKKQNP